MSLVSTLRLLLACVLLVHAGDVRAQESETPAPADETQPPTDDGTSPAGESESTTEEAEDDGTSQAQPEATPDAGQVSTVTDNEQDFPFYKGDHLRFQNADIFKRTGATLIGSVLEIGKWAQEAWLWAGGTAAVTIALMAPTDPSPDVRFQRIVQEQRTRKLNKAMPPLRTVQFRQYGMGGIGLLALYGAFGDKPRVLEAASLSMEAVTVAVTLHLVQKLAIGREGPTDGDGLGIIYGPTEGIHLYPAGTPSGHTASVWAMSTVLMDQVDTWWGYTLGWTINGYVAVSLVYNNQHYISDIIWGAPIGYFVGKWVSEHRSSKYTYRDGIPYRVSLERKKVRFATIAPLADNGTGIRGVQAVWTF